LLCSTESVQNSLDFFHNKAAASAFYVHTYIDGATILCRLTNCRPSERRKITDNVCFS
jgi:hypothetical protein